MDHKNLTYYCDMQKLNPCAMRWRLFLSEFDIKLEYVLGKELVQADALSRRHDHVDQTHDENMQIMLPESMFVRMIAMDLRDEVKEGTKNNLLAQKIIKALEEKSPMPIRGEHKDWLYIDGILRKKGICYVPDDIKLWKKLVRTYHEAPTSRHPGKYKTLMLLIKN